MNNLQVVSPVGDTKSAPTTREILPQNATRQTHFKDSDDINVSGHEQELDRQFGLVSIISAGIVTGNTWTALGGAIVSVIASKCAHELIDFTDCRPVQWRSSWCTV